MTKKQIIIPTKREKDIVADISFDDSNNDKKQLIIFCHGYKGFKDWGAWNKVADEFVNAGFIFLKFNFSHNGGTIDEPIDFPDLNSFGKNTYTKEIEDLHTVINWSQSNNGIPVIKNNVSLIGHSRGGGIVTIVANENKAVSKFITWAGVCDYKRRFPRGKKMKDWKEKGVYYIKNGRTNQDMPHFYSFYEDFIKNEQRLSIKNATKKRIKPHLIIHGSSDEAVSLTEAEQLKSWNPKAEFLAIENGNHTFDSKHPWEKDSLPKDLQTVVDRTIEFI